MKKEKKGEREKGQDKRTEWCKINSKGEMERERGNDIIMGERGERRKVKEEMRKTGWLERGNVGKADKEMVGESKGKENDKSKR